mmetsp:Transcript_19169/g.38764  ORF Transcript_19169/g.38764 Transcript_19169/m.38764 type:complete len:520 (-) Transcript_19169:446-2005(-)
MALCHESRAHPISQDAGSDGLGTGRTAARPCGGISGNELLVVLVEEGGAVHLLRSVRFGPLAEHRHVVFNLHSCLVKLRVLGFLHQRRLILRGAPRLLVGHDLWQIVLDEGKVALVRHRPFLLELAEALVERDKHVDGVRRAVIVVKPTRADLGVLADQIHEPARTSTVVREDNERVLKVVFWETRLRILDDALVVRELDSSHGLLVRDREDRISLRHPWFDPAIVVQDESGREVSCIETIVKKLWVLDVPEAITDVDLGLSHIIPARNAVVVGHEWNAETVHKRRFRENVVVVVGVHPFLVVFGHMELPPSLKVEQGETKVPFGLALSVEGLAVDLAIELIQVLPVVLAHASDLIIASAEGVFDITACLSQRGRFGVARVLATVNKGAGFISPLPDLASANQHLSLGKVLLGIPSLTHVTLDDEVVIHEDDAVQLLELFYVRDVETEVVEGVHVHRGVVPSIRTCSILISPFRIPVRLVVLDTNVVRVPCPNRLVAVLEDAVHNLVEFEGVDVQSRVK